MLIDGLGSPREVAEKRAGRIYLAQRGLTCESPPAAPGNPYTAARRRHWPTIGGTSVLRLVGYGINDYMGLCAFLIENRKGTSVTKPVELNKHPANQFYLTGSASGNEPAIFLIPDAALLVAAPVGTPSRVVAPSPIKGAVYTPKVISPFPHKCPSCGAAAYIGLQFVDCSKKCNQVAAALPTKP